MCGGGVPQVVHRGEVSRCSCNNLPQLALLPPPPDRGLIKSEAYATVPAQQSLGLAKTPTKSLQSRNNRGPPAQLKGNLKDYLIV